ncbi:FadR/GntR family transcriptional regulator [Salipaludibacillus daqingensis]|uniref:FadR/GntR family transcriptional regulator n=1 Tax=Salipaludibacillus daqingensis TaxID=3041001 RepID=UPI00247392EC|nr:FadR/GntR family transcriptional regulator [Salipaludibacillus daqingensis]
MIKHVRSKKIYEIVAEQLTEMIINSEFEAGDRLPSVQQLAEDFDVGRSAIREALSAMKAMGLIEIRQGEGTFVKKVDFDISSKMIPSVILKKDLEQLFEVRKLNETGAARLAAINRTNQDIIELERIIDAMKRIHGNGELGEKADIDFHMAIVSATKNDMLYRLMTTVSDTMRESMKEARQLFLYSNPMKMTQLYQEHVAIFEAIKNQDSDGAYRAMMDHIVGVESELFKE